MSFVQRYYLECDFCGEHFGGPDAGDYDPNNFIFADSSKTGMEELLDYLLRESRDLGWIEVQYMTDKASLCSPQCASEWVLKPRIN